MKGKKWRIGTWLVLWIFIVSIGMTGFSQENEPPAERTSFQVQHEKKAVYKAGEHFFAELKYEIQKKKKNRFLWATETELTITRIRPVIKDGVPDNEVEGFKTNLNAKIWIEELSKTSCRIDISVNKQKFELKFGQSPKLVEENRLEDQEKDILEKLKNKLGIE